MKQEEGKDRLQNEIMTSCEVAEYLKISEKSVLRMAQNGEIPVTKVASQWRFMRSLVDDWLISRMAVGTRSGVLSYLEQKRAIVPVSRLVRPELVVPDLLPGSKREILGRLVEPLKRSGWIHDTEWLVDRLMDREGMLSTAIGRGGAVPHARNPEIYNIPEPCGVLGICRNGTDFEALDGKPTFVFFLFCANSEVVHLKIMAKITLIMRNTDAVEKIRNARDAGEAIAILIRAEREIESESLM